MGAWPSGSPVPTSLILSYVLIEENLSVPFLVDETPALMRICRVVRLPFRCSLGRYVVSSSGLAPCLEALKNSFTSSSLMSSLKSRTH